MSKTYQQASSFLSRLTEDGKQKQNVSPKTEPNNALRSMLGMHTIDIHEADEIEDILLENATSSETQAVQFKRDVEQLKTLTSEIRSIQKQSALLIGERVHMAREILKKYRNGSTTFTEWLTSTFSSRRTAYNCLAYYELYCALPGEKLKNQLQAMSHKAVYILASRTGSWEKKIDIVERFSHLKQQEILPIIQKAFPLEKAMKRSASRTPLAQTTASLCSMLSKKPVLNASERRHLSELRSLLNKALR